MVASFRVVVYCCFCERHLPCLLLVRILRPTHGSRVGFFAAPRQCMGTHRRMFAHNFLRFWGSHHLGIMFGRAVVDSCFCTLLANALSDFLGLARSNAAAHQRRNISQDTAAQNSSSCFVLQEGSFNMAPKARRISARAQERMAGGMAALSVQSAVDTVTTWMQDHPDKAAGL